MSAFMQTRNPRNGLRLFYHQTCRGYHPTIVAREVCQHSIKDERHRLANGPGFQFWGSRVGWFG